MIRYRSRRLAVIATPMGSQLPIGLLADAAAPPVEKIATARFVAHKRRDARRTSAHSATM
jgi:hypothetical protein